MIILGDFWQLPPVHDYPIFNPFKSDNMKRLRCLDIWHSFKVHYLKTIMRQREDASFAVALNNMARGTMTTADVELFASRTFKELPEEVDVGRSEGIVRLFATNKEVNKCNEAIVAKFTTNSCVSTSFDRVVGQGGNNEARRSILELAKSPDTPVSKTSGLPYQLQLTVEVRYMITNNVDTSDGLVNGATGILRRIDLGHNSRGDDGESSTSKPVRVWLEMDSSMSGAKTRGKNGEVARRLGISENWTPILPVSCKFQRRKNSVLQVMRTQFPMVIAEAMTIHKSQGGTYTKVILDLAKSNGTTNNKLTRSMMYVACSRATQAQGLYIKSNSGFTPTAPPALDDPLVIECQRHNEVKLMPPFQFLRNSHGCVQMLVHNVQSLKPKLDGIRKDAVYCNSQLLLFVETWTTVNMTPDIDGFTVISRVDVEGYVPKPYGNVVYIKPELLSTLGSVIAIEKLIRTPTNGNISIAGFDSDSLLLLSVYISPTAEIDVAIESIESLLVHNTAKRIILAGDFNYDFKISRVTNFTNMLARFNLKSTLPLNFSSTTKHGTFIDNIFCNFPFSKSGRYISYTKSHHDPLYALF